MQLAWPAALAVSAPPLHAWLTERRGGVGSSSRASTPFRCLTVEGKLYGYGNEAVCTQVWSLPPPAFYLTTHHLLSLCWLQGCAARSAAPTPTTSATMPMASLASSRAALLAVSGHHNIGSCQRARPIITNTYILSASQFRGTCRHGQPSHRRHQAGLLWTRHHTLHQRMGPQVLRQR